MAKKINLNQEILKGIKLPIKEMIRIITIHQGDQTLQRGLVGVVLVNLIMKTVNSI
jgi:hypothetical protein